MRLYLSSFRMGDHPEHLLELLPGDRRAAVVANSMDVYEDRRLETEFSALAALGIEATEVDLRDYFGRSEQMLGELSRYDLVWVRGGNVFALRQAMLHSGADVALVELLRQDALVYGGYSAGPCVLAPSLRGLELCDSVEPVEELYAEPVTFHGLGILGFAFVPHVDSPGHPETEALGQVADNYARDGVPHRTFRDGQVFIVNGDQEWVA